MAMGYGELRTAPSPSAEYDRRARRPRRLVRRVVITFLVLVLAFVAGLWLYLDINLHRVAALPDYSGRPSTTAGTNWLLVGSDSRQGLTEQQKTALGTGDAAGGRTDTMMLLHVPSGSGQPTLVSLPRDTLVPINGHGQNKLNAAFAWGGPALLARTAEQATGLHIDHYVEIGLGGLVNVVDAVGGVPMCIPSPMHDPKAALDLQAGCQNLNGPQALGYVRTRAFATADLQRIQNQRQFLSSLLSKATSPGVLANPFSFFPMVTGMANAITVDNGDHLHNLAGLAFVLGGGVVSATVPVASTPTVSGVGSVVMWDTSKASQLFTALKEDKPVPANVLTQSGG